MWHWKYVCWDRCCFPLQLQCRLQAVVGDRLQCEKQQSKRLQHARLFQGSLLTKSVYRRWNVQQCRWKWLPMSLSSGLRSVGKEHLCRSMRSTRLQRHDKQLRFWSGFVSFDGAPASILKITFKSLKKVLVVVVPTTCYRAIRALRLTFAPTCVAASLDSARRTQRRTSASASATADTRTMALCVPISTIANRRILASLLQSVSINKVQIFVSLFYRFWLNYFVCFFIYRSAIYLQVWQWFEIRFDFRMSTAMRNELQWRRSVPRCIVFDELIVYLKRW